MQFLASHAIQWFEKWNEKIQQNEQYLTKLDQQIGDGDHGINMAKGFTKVMEVLNEKEFVTVTDVMKTAALTVMSKVNGASGPLYGTAFLQMSFVFSNKPVVDDATFLKGLEKALEGLKERGKSTKGEKTLIDVWDAVITELQRTKTCEAELIIATAKEAMVKTKDSIAKKGRATYLKENSIGHIDPGAVSSFYLFAALAEVLREGEIK